MGKVMNVITSLKSLSMKGPVAPRCVKLPAP